MKRLALSCCALLLLTGAAAAKAGVAASTVNLRAEANTTSEVLAKIPAGARVDVADCKDNWCAVTYQGKAGFSIATALDTTGRPRRVLRRLPGVTDPDDDFIPAGPGPGPAVVYAPGPYYYGPGPYYGPGWGYRGWYGYGYGWRGGWRRW